MRFNESANRAREMANELAKFSFRSNHAPISYDTCRNNLFVAGKKVEKTLSSASRVVRTIFSAIRVLKVQFSKCHSRFMRHYIECP